jgi:hypothetical protein
MEPNINIAKWSENSAIALLDLLQKYKEPLPNPHFAPVPLLRGGSRIILASPLAKGGLRGVIF